MRRDWTFSASESILLVTVRLLLLSKGGFDLVFNLLGQLFVASQLMRMDSTWLLILKHFPILNTLRQSSVDSASFKITYF